MEDILQLSDEELLLKYNRDKSSLNTIKMAIDEALDNLNNATFDENGIIENCIDSRAIGLTKNEYIDGMIKTYLEIEEYSFNPPFLYDESYLEKFIRSDKNDVLKKFVELFSEVSLLNTVYAHLSFHLILGQLLKNVKIKYGKDSILDCRIHFFISQDSGSGKSKALIFIKKICDELKIPIEIIEGEINEASLMGSFKEKHTKGGIVRIEEEGLYRKYEDGGILFFDEAGLFMRHEQKEYNPGILEYIQGATNEYYEPNSVLTRNLKGISIKVHPYVSIAMITFPIENKVLDLLKRGFFQRIFPYFRILTRDEWLQLQKLYNKKLYEGLRMNIESKSWNLDIEEKKYKNEIDNLVKSLLDVKNFAMNKKITIEHGALDFLNNVSEEINNKISSTSKDIQEYLNTFRIRSINNIIKISTHRALINKRTEIKVEDLEYASNLVKNIIFSLIEQIEGLKEVAREKDAYKIRWEEFKKEKEFLIKNLLRENNKNKISVNNFKKLIEDHFGVSDRSAHRIIIEWDKRKLIKYIRGDPKTGEGEIFL